MDLLYLLIIITCGIIFGIITGLIPGIHINLVSTFIVINATFLLTILSKKYLVIFILIMGVIHSFMDFIPSILFGVPDSETALSALPAHRLVNQGCAYKALFLSALGSLSGAVFSFAIIPIFFILLKNIYANLKSFIPYFLIFIIILLISFEKGLNKKFWAIVIILFSSGLGMLSLNSFLFSNSLLPIFTGLFGMASISHALRNKSKIPEQDFKIKFKFSKDYLTSLFVGGSASILASITPGIGDAQAATISSVFFKNITSENFIFVLSSINTINFILSFITFYLISKARNGSVLAISKIIQTITIQDIKLYLLLIFVASIIGFFLTLLIGKKIIKNIFKLDEKKINISIIIFLFLIVGILTGPIGILLMISATALGILAISLKVSRVHLMSILLVPIIFNLI